jgi:hypothetical protein
MIIWHRRYPDAKGGTKQYVPVTGTEERNLTGFPSAFKKMNAAMKGQQACALQEQVDKLEARNEEMEGILESMGDVLRQHTSRWATARSMLEKLESLASPSVIVGGQAFLKGLQNSPTPQMGHCFSICCPNYPKSSGQIIWRSGK